MQGTIKIGEGQYIRYDEIWKVGNGRYTARLSDKPPYTPYYDGAVGPSYSDTYVFILAFLNTPSQGFFFGADSGGAIRNGDLDIYMGEGNAGINEALEKYKSVDMKKSGVFGDAGTSNFPAYHLDCDWHLTQ